MEMKVVKRQKPIDDYQFLLFSQTSPGGSWKAFRNEDELYKWVSLYKGMVLEKDDVQVKIDIPFVHEVGCTEKFFHLITDLTDLHCLSLFGKMLHLKDENDKYRFAKYKKYVLEDGVTTFNGKKTPCKRFFFFKDEMQVPEECIVVVCRYKTVSPDGKVIEVYQ